MRYSSLVSAPSRLPHEVYKNKISAGKRKSKEKAQFGRVFAMYSGDGFKSETIKAEDRGTTTEPDSGKERREMN